MKRIVRICVCLTVGFLLAGFFSIAQERSDADLIKEYAPILGEYEFVFGGQASIIRFYIEENALWADSGDGRPATLVPVENEEFSFTASDPISGEFEIRFLKDDQGEYTKCRLASASMGLEAEGTKIK